MRYSPRLLFDRIGPRIDDYRETRVILTMQFGDKALTTAFDIFQLVKLKGRWWITSITGEVPKPGVDVPKDLLA
jgi:hypothetical protein